MKRSLIPWHVFHEALESQDSQVLENWLGRWGFTNDGVVLIGVDVSPQAQSVAGPHCLTQDTPAALARLSLQDLVKHLTREASPFINDETVKLWSCNEEL